MKNAKVKVVLTVVAIACMFMLMAQTAMATVSAGSDTSAPQVSSSSTSGGTTSGGTTATTTGGKTPQTGAEMVLLAVAGAGLLGAGYFMIRKSKAQA